MAKGRAAAVILVELEKRELTTLTRKHGGRRSRWRIELGSSLPQRAVSLNLWVHALERDGLRLNRFGIPKSVGF